MFKQTEFSILLQTISNNSNEFNMVIIVSKFTLFLPFSILDKIDILSQNGFKRYLIDFSKTKISRGELKSIQASMSKKQVLPEVSRFNWKNGFYNPEQIEAYKSLTNTTSKTNGKKPLKKSFRSKS